MRIVESVKGKLFTKGIEPGTERKNKMLKTKLFYTVKEKTNVIGYWKNDTGKLFKDYINVISCHYSLDILKKELFNKGELSVFYIHNGEAFIESKEGTVINLKTQNLIRRARITKKFFKTLLSKYNGFTVYKKNGYYQFEIWTA